MSKNCERGVSLWVILAVVAVLVGGAAYNYNASQNAKRAAAAAAAAADERSYTESLVALTRVMTKFDDAVKIAESTSRISLAAPVGNLQSIMREAEALKVHECLSEAQTIGVKRMNSITEMFLVFMRNGDEIRQRQLAQDGSKQLWDFMAKLKICADSRKKP